MIGHYKYRLLLFLCLGISMVHAQVNDQLILLKNMRIIDGIADEAIENGSILIREGRIEAVSDSIIPVPEGAEVMDLSGKTVLPGFVNMHAHFWPLDQPNYRPVSKLMLAGGITTAFSLGDIQPEKLQAFRQLVNEGKEVGPTIYTVGPYFQGGQVNARFRAVNTVEEALNLYNEWKDKIEGIKFYVSISQECFDAVIKEAQKDGKIVTAHLMSIKTEHAIDMGINGLEHGVWTIDELIPKTKGMGNFCRIASMNMDTSEMERIMDKMIEKGVYISPTIVPMEALWAERGSFVPNWQIYLGDSLRMRYNTPNTRNQECMPGLFEKQVEFIQRMYKKGALIVTGTDPFYPNTPPGFDIHREMIALTEAGLSNMDAIKAATINGAIALKRDQEFGSIQTGKIADLVIVAGNPDLDIQEVANVISVMKKGKLFNTAQLRTECIGEIKMAKK